MTWGFASFSMDSRVTSSPSSVAGFEDESKNKTNGLELYVEKITTHPRILGAFLFASWVLLLVYGFQAFNGLQDGGFYPPQCEAAVTLNYFENRYVSPVEDVFILVSHPIWTVDDAQYQLAYQDFKTKLTSQLPVYSLISYFDYPDVVTNLSEDRKRAKITARTEKGTTVTLSQYKSVTSGSPLTFDFAGSSLANNAVNEALVTDIAAIEYGALPVLIVILCFVFEGIIAMLFPIALAAWTLACVLALLRVTSLGFNVSTFTINATTIFGIGLAIDFALFMHIRFKEEYARNNGNVKLAVEKALSTSGRAVLFSGCTLFFCLAGVLQFHEFYLSTMALAVMYAAVTACIGAWTVLPVMYTLIGHRTFSLHTDTLYKAIYTYGLVAYTSVRGQAYKSDLQDAEAYGDAKAPGDLAEKGVSKIDLVASEDPASPPKDTYGYSQAEYNRITSGYWYRSTRFVMAHPWVFLAGLLGCLGGLMYVFINNVRFGSGGTSLIPVDSEIRYAFDKFVAYIPGGNGAAINVFMQTSAPLGVRAPGFLTALDDYSANVKAISPHIITVRNLVRYNKSSTLSDYISIYADPYSAANFNATRYLDAPFYITDLNTISGTLIYLDLDTNDQQMFNIIRKVRALTSGSSVTSYLQAYGVGGGSALEFDIQQDVKETLPNMVAVIICAMGLMLTLLSASFVIPIKAIITATLSIISSFAFLVLVFQDGPQNAQDLLQFIPNGVLDPLNLIFIFAVAFGLSLDYEIFMISRIQELWLRTNDHYFAVAAGIEESARAITLAALLLCVVLGAFLASKIIILKEIGMGIGLTILLDATIIRCILVPAMMALFGEYTWWAPKPVQDAVTRLGLMEKHHSDVGAVSDSIPKPLRE